MRILRFFAVFAAQNDGIWRGLGIFSQPLRMSGSPSLPPPLPLVAGRLQLRDVHLLPHVRDAPSGEVRDVDHLALLPVAQLAAIVARGGTIGAARPRMMHDIARLEVALVAGLLE